MQNRSSIIRLIVAIVVLVLMWISFIGINNTKYNHLSLEDISRMETNKTTIELEGIAFDWELDISKERISFEYDSNEYSLEMMMFDSIHHFKEGKKEYIIFQGTVGSGLLYNKFYIVDLTEKTVEDTLYFEENLRIKLEYDRGLMAYLLADSGPVFIGKIEISPFEIEGMEPFQVQ